MQWKGRVSGRAGGGMREGEGAAQTSRQISELRDLLGELAGHDGEHPTAIRSLRLVRHSSSWTSREAVLTPTFFVTVEGLLELRLGEEACSCGPGQHVVSSGELPVSGRSLFATPAIPYLGLRVQLDRGGLRSLIEEARLSSPATDSPPADLRRSRTGPPLLDVVLRLVRLLRSPGEISVLGPMIERELLFRLLLDETGMALHRAAHEDGQPRRIDAAIVWLRQHFREPFRVDDLARRTGMSVSSFHQWFRGVTGMSPLQYQKQLRLEEARRMLRSECHDVGTVSRAVGYESSSQFSREYRRLFGNPPAREFRRPLEEHKIRA